VGLSLHGLFVDNSKTAGHDRPMITPSERLNSLLLQGVRNRDPLIIKKVIKEGADPNIMGHAPMRTAICLDGQKSVIEELSKAGGKLAQDDLGSLKFLSMLGNPDNFQTVLEHWPGGLKKLTPLLEDPDLGCLWSAFKAAKKARLKTEISPETWGMEI
jgi:hypothetical protein